MLDHQSLTIFVYACLACMIGILAFISKRFIKEWDRVATMVANHDILLTLHKGDIERLRENYCLKADTCVQAINPEALKRRATDARQNPLSLTDSGAQVLLAAIEAAKAKG